MRWALLAGLVALSSIAQAQENKASEHRFGVSAHTGVQLYLSDARTMGGLGGGVGVRDVWRDRFVFALDASYLTEVGNAFSLRAIAGVQRSGTWAPAASLTLTTLLGDRLSITTKDHPVPSFAPVPALGVMLEPLRFQGDRTFVSVAQLGVGLGADFPGTGTSIQVGLLEVGAEWR